MSTCAYVRKYDYVNLVMFASFRVNIGAMPKKWLGIPARKRGTRSSTVWLKVSVAMMVKL